MGHNQHDGQLRGARDSRSSLEATIDRAEFVEQRKGSNGTIYVIRRVGHVEPGEDRWTCTCKGFRYRSRNKMNYHCRHIREVRECLIQRI